MKVCTTSNLDTNLTMSLILLSELEVALHKHMKMSLKQVLSLNMFPNIQSQFEREYECETEFEFESVSMRKGHSTHDQSTSLPRTTLSSSLGRSGFDCFCPAKQLLWLRMCVCRRASGATASCTRPQRCRQKKNSELRTEQRNADAGSQT
jgi:hypothetical protein